MRLKLRVFPSAFCVSKECAGRKVGAAEVLMHTSESLAFFKSSSFAWQNNNLLLQLETSILWPEKFKYNLRNFKGYIYILKLISTDHHTSLVEKMTGWSNLISKVGMMTLVRVCFRVRLPSSSAVNDRRYLPSYFGPITEPSKLVAELTKLLCLLFPQKQLFKRTWFDVRSASNCMFPFMIVIHHFVVDLEFTCSEEKFWDSVLNRSWWCP